MTGLSKRPTTLAEVSRRALGGQQDFDPALREFLDEFYSNPDQRQSALQQEPDLVDCSAAPCSRVGWNRSRRH